LKRREFVFTSTKGDGELQGHYPDGWRTVCIGSCRTQAFVGASYRVSGTGVPNSKEFAVPDAPYPFSVRARAGSTTEQAAGVAMIGVGSLSLGVALLLIPVAMCAESCSGADQAERDRAAVARVAFWPVVVGGLITTAVGVALLIGGGTTLDIHSGEQARAPHLRLGRGFELTPTGFVF
jgi:hypothetical protein